MPPLKAGGSLSADALPDREVPLSEPLQEIVDHNPESRQEICHLAEDTDSVVLALIAPYIGVRVDPIHTASASFSIREEFAVESVIERISSSSRTSKLILLINSPGGALSASYKVARALRTSFDQITTVVPHIAASGATMVALASNEIVMGHMSQLSPVDVQLGYKGNRISAASFFRALDLLQERFRSSQRDEVAYPWQALADKLDPVICGEWMGIQQTSQFYAYELLTMAGTDEKKAHDIAFKLVNGYGTHDFVLNFERAKGLGLPVRWYGEWEHSRHWQVLRHWLASYVLQSSSTHIIRYAVPGGTTQNDGKQPPAVN